jgi:hypothetical protein
MRRYKVVIGRILRARTLPTQKTEAKIGCKVLNVMTALSMRISYRIVIPDRPTNRAATLWIPIPEEATTIRP